MTGYEGDRGRINDPIITHVQSNNHHTCEDNVEEELTRSNINWTSNKTAPKMSDSEPGEYDSTTNVPDEEETNPADSAVDETGDEGATGTNVDDSAANDLTETEEEGGVTATEEDAESVGEINITDSQVMIQLKEAEDEAELIRKEIAEIRNVIQDYKKRPMLTEEDAEYLSEKQNELTDKLKSLDKLTKLIEKLMELAGNIDVGGDDEDAPLFEDDLLPRVVVCSSWDDMMPKIVVCVDMKKKSFRDNEEDDGSGLSPEQKEALEEERRLIAEEKERLEQELAMMENEMRIMMRENDRLNQKVTEMEANQPEPFAFEMTVSGTQQPGQRIKTDQFRPTPNAPGDEPTYCLDATLKKGTNIIGNLTMGDGRSKKTSCSPNQGPPCSANSAQQKRQSSLIRDCSGPYGTPGAHVPCPAFADAQPTTPGGVQQGKICRKEFLKQHNIDVPFCKNCPNRPKQPSADIKTIDNKRVLSASVGGPGECKREQYESLQNEYNQPVPININFKMKQGPAQTDSNNRSETKSSQLKKIEQEIMRLQEQLEMVKENQS